MIRYRLCSSHLTQFDFECHRRHLREWQQPSYWKKEIRRDMREWLDSKIGNPLNEYWDVDRPLYAGDEKPDLEKEWKRLENRTYSISPTHIVFIHNRHALQWMNSPYYNLTYNRQAIERIIAGTKIRSYRVEEFIRNASADYRAIGLSPKLKAVDFDGVFDEYSETQISCLKNQDEITLFKLAASKIIKLEKI